MLIENLQTKRLLIRPFEPEDLPAIPRLYGETSDPEARERWLTWLSLSPAQLARLKQVPYGDRAVIQRSDNALVGAVGLVPILLPPIPPGETPDTLHAESGPMRPAMGLYWEIAEDCRGRGYATEAARALIDAAAAALNLAEIYAVTTADNTASQRVMTKLGMTVRRNTSGQPVWLEVLGDLPLCAPTPGRLR